MPRVVRTPLARKDRKEIGRYLDHQSQIVSVADRMFELARLLIAVGNQIRRALLSRREKELLGSCADCDTIRFLPYDGRLSIAISGSAQWPQNEPIEEQRYIDAFMSLVRLGFFTGENEVYRLTISGRTRAQNFFARGFHIARRDPAR